MLGKILTQPPETFLSHPGTHGGLSTEPPQPGCLHLDQITAPRAPLPQARAVDLTGPRRDMSWGFSQDTSSAGIWNSKAQTRLGTGVWQKELKTQECWKCDQKGSAQIQAPCVCMFSVPEASPRRVLALIGTHKQCWFYHLGGWLSKWEASSRLCMLPSGRQLVASEHGPSLRSMAETLGEDDTTCEAAAGAQGSHARHPRWGCTMAQPSQAPLAPPPAQVGQAVLPPESP